jgi:hypothetical protein
VLVLGDLADADDGNRIGLGHGRVLKEKSDKSGRSLSKRRRAARAETLFITWPSDHGRATCKDAIDCAVSARAWRRGIKG